MPSLTGRQWTTLVVGSTAAVLAVVAGWSAGSPLAERIVLAGGVGVLTFAAQFALFFKMNSKRRKAAHPAMLPRPLAEFRGRSNDLEALKALYAEQAASRHRKHPSHRHHLSSREGLAIGPIMLLIHGKPGVGKSTIARELANQLADYFPDGQLYANLGSGGDARTTGEVLGEFILALGRRPKRKAGRRRKEFLAATAHRRLLIVLDAARDAEQLRKLLPNGSGCCVIVTSRRAIGSDFDTAPHHLRVPDTADALEILSAFAHLDWRQQPECAADLVRLCGHLPLALRSIGEQMADRKRSLREVADTLNADRSQTLSRLTYGGKNVEEDLYSEYERLTDREKKAFRFLTLVESTTFIPWVLHPLLDIDIIEAENLVAQLAEAELLELVGPDNPLAPDNPLGIARYRFDPLIGLFAEARLGAEGNVEEQRSARERLDNAYMELIGRVLAHLDPSLDRLLDSQVSLPKWLPERSTLPERVSELPSHWVRADYKNWMRACAAAYHSENWELCWRISTFFGGPVPDRPDGDQCDSVFAFAEHAALQGQVAWAPAEVLLAKGTFLLALERYGEALATFDLAAQAIDSLKFEPGHGESALRLDAIRHRKMAEGWIQLGAYGRAEIELTEALSIFRQLSPGIELDRVLLLKAENENRTALGRRKYESPVKATSPESDDALWFRRQLLLSESARIERNWSTAAQYLQIALAQNYGDTRRTANVCYRLARLRLNQARHVNIHEQSIGLAWDAVGFVATALNVFQDMKNIIGVVRSRSLLARALVVAEQLTEAQNEIGIAQSELNAISRSEGRFVNPLRARLSFAQGEIWLHQQRYAEASQMLSDAVARFASENDRRSQIEALLLRGVTERFEKRFASSNITLWAVAAAFKASGDDGGVVFALEQLALTAEQMRQFGTAMELRMLAHNGSVKHLSPLMAITLARSLYTHRGDKRSDPLAHDHDIHLPV